MDPLTTILAALAAAGGQVGTQALLDGYAALKALIVRKARSQSGLEEVLDDYVKAPDVKADAAAERLRSAEVEHDDEILVEARQLLQMARAAEPARVENLVGHLQAKNVAVIRENKGPINFS